MFNICFALYHSKSIHERQGRFRCSVALMTSLSYLSPCVPCFSQRVVFITSLFKIAHTLNVGVILSYHALYDHASSDRIFFLNVTEPLCVHLFGRGYLYHTRFEKRTHVKCGGYFGAICSVAPVPMKASVHPPPLTYP